MPFPRPGQEPWVVPQLRTVLMRHKDATVIWAHMGVGRIVHPVKDQLAMMEKGLANPDLKNLHIDLSWTEVAKYVVETPETIRAVADLMNRYPERFLFGTDEVAPTDQKAYLKTYDMYQPLLAALTPDARAKFLRGNYERLFDAARTKVRAWERANVK
jgi:predicted TIM-barrel fold metal-dependent hydrolase